MTKRFRDWLSGKWSRTTDPSILQAYQVTFSTPQGRMVLNHLLDNVYCQTCPTMEPIALATHNGRRSVVQEILQNIDLAEKPLVFNEQEMYVERSA